MSVGDYLRDAFPWHRRCADALDAVGAVIGGTTGFSSNAYSITTSPAITRLLANQSFLFTASNANTSTTPTLNTNGIGAKTMKRFDNTTLELGEIAANGTYLARYNSSDDVFNISNTQLSAMTDWTPTLGAGGAMTFTSTSINQASYVVQGQRVWFTLDITGTTGGTGNTDLTFTLPFAAVNQRSVGGGAIVFSAGNRIAGYYSNLASNTVVTVSRADNANYGLGAGSGFVLNGFYKRA